jgi:hypothetical protein
MHDAGRARGPSANGSARRGLAAAASRTRLVRATVSMCRYISRRRARRMRRRPATTATATAATGGQGAMRPSRPRCTRDVLRVAMALGGLFGCWLLVVGRWLLAAAPVARRRHRQPKPSGHRRVQRTRRAPEQRRPTRAASESVRCLAAAAAAALRCTALPGPAAGAPAWRIVVASKAAANRRRPQCWVGSPVR